jgi:Carboxypeptidase regulatory-like domain/TonB-dependent Receptor Plug Domain
MIRSRRRALPRAIRCLTVARLAFGAAALAAQAPAGKIEGRVWDRAGVPIAEAQLSIAGTAFHALSDPRGNYFINNVPAGSASLRAVFIGYRPLEVRDLRVFAGQTITQDFVLEPAPVELQEISVVAASNVLVPRDEVTTKQRVEGAYVDRLPVDRLVEVLALQPGVVANAQGAGLSVRGGRPGETAVYVDGVPVTGIPVATNALEEASVTTGATSAEFGNFQSGVISIQTRTGGTRYRGAFSYETDEPFGASHGIGFNRLEASLGGPIARRLSFFVSGMLDGARSATAGKDAEKYPVFVQAGVDTTVAVPSSLGLATADTTYVDVANFAIYRGECTAFRRSRSPGIRDNYGLPCKGIRLPASANSTYRLQGKLSYTWGSGSRLALTLLRTQSQNREFSYQSLYNPENLTGFRSWGNVFTLNWTENIARAADRALALDTYLSYQQDREIDSPLEPSAESSTRDPFGGFLIRPLGLLWDFHNFPLNRELVDNYLINRRGSRRSPLDLENVDQYAVVDQYRNNAYALPGWAESGGPAGSLFLYRENRLIGRSNIDWQADRNNRLRAGAEFARYSITNYLHALTSTDGDIYIERPLRWNAFVENRLDLGDLVLVGGLRYDWFDSRASRPAGYPRISTRPGFDPAHPTAGFIRDRSHDYLSPHVQVAFPVTTRTNFRLSYAHQVQVPDWSFIFAGINGENGLNYFDARGSDLDFGKTILFEFGIRHAFSDDMVLDLTAYNKDNLANTSVRNIRQYDSVRGQELGVAYFTNADYGNTRGLDLRLDRRIGTVFNGMVGYTFQDAKSTGSDPFTNIRRAFANFGQLSGDLISPPQSIATTETSRPHSFTGELALNLPEHWRQGTVLGTLLQNLGIYAVFRFASGTAYTPCREGLGNATAGGQCVDPGPVNSARLPAFKQFDLRLTKSLPLRGLDLTAYLDARNLFDFTNLLRVFSTTRGTHDARDRQFAWARDSTSYAVEGQASGVAQPDGTLDLSFAGAGAPGCANWMTGGGRPAAPNCLYLIRAEERYGDGDHRFTIAEQRRASDAFYGLAGGINTFTGTPRRLRIGLEVSF